MAPRIKVREKDTQKACLDLLAAERVWAIRLNTGSFRDSTGRPVRVHSGGAGVADILATPEVDVGECGDGYRSPVPLWVEVKSSEGQQTREQFLFQQQVEAAGHHYLLVNNVDQLRDWLRDHQ